MHTRLRRTDRTSSLTVRSHCFLPRAALVDESTLTFFRSGTLPHGSGTRTRKKSSGNRLRCLAFGVVARRDKNSQSCLLLCIQDEKLHTKTLLRCPADLRQLYIECEIVSR